MALFENKNKVIDNKYSRVIKTPQYEITGQKPQLVELFNIEKYSKLIYNINNSNVSEEEKNFLRKAAARHIVFNYEQIAEYYAHASEEMQELMEESALVILDIDDAIANGYVKLSTRIKEIVKENKKKGEDEND